jgi:hypothetical protein
MYLKVYVDELVAAIFPFRFLQQLPVCAEINNSHLKAHNYTKKSPSMTPVGFVQKFGGLWLVVQNSADPCGKFSPYVSEGLAP